MNFIKKIGIAAALFGSVTVANAQIKVEGDGTGGAAVSLPITVKIPEVATLTLTNKILKIDRATGATTYNTAFNTAEGSIVPTYIGKAEVNVNWPLWEVWVSAANGLTLKSATSAAQTLRCYDGTDVDSDASVLLKACYFKNTTTKTDCETADYKSGVGAAAGVKVPLTSATEARLSSVIAPSSGGTDGFFTNADVTGGKGTFVFLAGVVCDWPKLFSDATGTGSFTETLTLTLTTGY